MDGNTQTSRIPNDPVLALEAPPPPYSSGTYGEEDEEWSQTVSEEGGGHEEEYPQISYDDTQNFQGESPAPFDMNEEYEQGEGEPMLTDSPTRLEEPPKNVVVHPGQWEQKLNSMEDGVQQMWSALGELESENEVALNRVHQILGQQRAENDKIWGETTRQIEIWMGQIQNQLSEVQVTPVQMVNLLEQVQAIKAVLQSDQPTLHGEGGDHTWLSWWME